MSVGSSYAGKRGELIQNSQFIYNSEFIIHNYDYYFNL